MTDSYDPPYRSIDPATAELLEEFSSWSDTELTRRLTARAGASAAWRKAPVAERAAVLTRLAAELRAAQEPAAACISREMGKPVGESRAELEKCARLCDYYAGQAESLLQEEIVPTEARRSAVILEPLGTILAIMPWNFPFWQVLRAAIPALLTGNAVLLKHAENVPRCASFLEALFRRAGIEDGVFRWLPITRSQTERLLATDWVQAVTLTGSSRAGRRIAALAGAALKKSVLELGGSDPFIVLDDADLDRAAAVAVTARYQNTGQSCIAAKRFILVDAIADAFLERFRAGAEALVVGPPLAADTQVGPLARADLREQLHRQVQASIRCGARPLLGCHPLDSPGFFYAPSILDGVSPGCPAHDEELFGPVAAIQRVADERAALAAANAHRLGLGASVWTRDLERGERCARALRAGLCFVNDLVRSDPRLPFGGVGESGYGRELSHYGLRELANIKTLWLG